MGQILGDGLNQRDLVDLLVLFKTNWNGVLSKLDADAGVTDVNYNSLGAVSMPAGIRTTGDKAIRTQHRIQVFLNDLVTKFNATLAKLDADAGVSSTDYTSSFTISNPIGTTAGKTIRASGMSQGSLVHLLKLFITNLTLLNAHLDADAGVTDTNYGSLWNIAASKVDSTRTKA